VPSAFFTSDLHGHVGRYRALWRAAAAELPDAIFLGGDLFPHAMDRSWDTAGAGADFVSGILAPGFAELRRRTAGRIRVFLILGNDDPAAWESDLRTCQEDGLWEYIHGRRVEWGSVPVYGYNCVPPTPFLLKDWERYDVSRFVDPGCVSPEEGQRTDELTARDMRWTTIKEELEALAGDDDQADAVWLFHTPPYDTRLDWADLDGRTIDHVPLDPHVGSIAVRRFIERRQPRITLHGHVHETARLSGDWRDGFAATHCFSGAHYGTGLALVRFDPARPQDATRELLSV